MPHRTVEIAEDATSQASSSLPPHKLNDTATSSPSEQHQASPSHMPTGQTVNARLYALAGPVCLLVVGLFTKFMNDTAGGGG